MKKVYVITSEIDGCTAVEGVYADRKAAIAYIKDELVPEFLDTDVVREKDSWISEVGTLSLVEQELN